MRVQASPWYSQVAKLASTLIWRALASMEASPTVFPSLTEPLRGRAPATKRRLSIKEVFPER